MKEYTPGVSPKETSYPVLIYNSIKIYYDKNLQKESGFITQKVQFTVVDSTYAKASLNGEVIRAVFKDFKGDMAGMEILASHFETNILEVVETNEYIAILEIEFQYNC